MSSSIRIDRLCAVNIYEISPNFRIAEHTHGEWEFFYVDSGKMSHLSGGEERTLSSGDILFHRPQSPHATFCNGRESASLFNIHFRTRSAAMEVFSDLSCQVPRRLIPLLKRIIEETQETYEVGKPVLALRTQAAEDAEGLIRVYLELFLMELRRELSAEKKNRTPKEEAAAVIPTDEIVQCLQAHIYDRISLDMLSRQFHFGKTHLCVYFKRKYGVSIIQFYTGLKIAEAKRLLREENWTITQIAQKLKFDSLEYFCRCFKKHVGYSPQTYRTLLLTEDILRKD